ncbi:MAG: hypothetical protein O2973_06045 [Gemmatimonadetes bacterium]|nr:hypothetical protein [Gemmatimonadota bacterium]
MKRIIALVCVVIGCRTVPGAMATGSASPRAAAELMLAGAKIQDLQTILSVFGDETGLVRDRESRDVVESRAFILACVLKSDSQKLSDAQPLGTGRMIVMADLTQGSNSATTRFELAPTKDGRWLVTNVDIQALQNKGFCARPGR